MGTTTLSIGITALNAAQLGLQTTSHNIANASTAGYTRQQIVQTSNTPQFTGSGFLGEGTNVQTIKRLYSDYLSGQVLTAQTGAAEMDSYLTQIQQIDNLLADSSAGLSPAMSSFFSSIQDVASNPSSLPSRQAMLSSAQSLVARFQAIDTRLTEIRDGVNGQISSEISTINAYATQIASLNQRIIDAQASSANQPANDLLDQRDQLIVELNKEIRVTTTTQSDGSFNVFIGNGQPLVIGNQAFSMQAVASPDDPERTVVAMQMPGSTTTSILQESLLTGGNLGGLISFRSQSLDEAQNALGRVALGLAQNFNDQHQLGVDLTGALGTAFFNVPSPTVYANATNTGGASLSASLTNVSQLTTSDYRLTLSAANTFTLVRLSDNTSWTGTGASQAAALTNLQANVAASSSQAQGFSMSLTGAMTVGDSFMIQPTRAGAHNLSVALGDPRNIAAAAPIRTAAAMTNTGTGKISAGSVVGPPPTNANLQDNVRISFTSATTFDVLDVTTSTTLATGQPFTPGTGATVSFNGWSLQLTGQPAANDVFTLGPNSSGTGDNRNALLLSGLQTQNTLAGGTATYQSAYSQIVATVGNKAREVEVTGQAQQSLADDAKSARDSLSGVNLDEEAANLLKYQQAYQAAAKVIEIAGKLFDEVLSMAK